MLVSKTNQLEEFWRPILSAANATIVTTLPNSTGTSTSNWLFLSLLLLIHLHLNPINIYVFFKGKASNTPDMIIADTNCTPTLIKKAKTSKIPIVSSEYVIQCLINGRKLPVDAHEKFNHSYKAWPCIMLFVVFCVLSHVLICIFKIETS